LRFRLGSVRNTNQLQHHGERNARKQPRVAFPHGLNLPAQRHTDGFLGGRLVLPDDAHGLVRPLDEVVRLFISHAHEFQQAVEIVPQRACPSRKRQFGEMPGLKEMSSVSSAGSSVIWQRCDANPTAGMAYRYGHAVAVGNFRATNGSGMVLGAGLTLTQLATDPKLKQLQDQLAEASKPVPTDPRLGQLRKDIEMSIKQAAARRLTAAQDVAWALINSPAFLFNH